MPGRKTEDEEGSTFLDDEVQAFLPLSPPVFQVLLALGNSRLHGYGIIQEFERLTGQRGALLPGSLYNTMSRMLKAGLIEESQERPRSGDDERRRYYLVTPLGTKVAAAESARLRALLDLAHQRRFIGDPGPT